MLPPLTLSREVPMPVKLKSSNCLYTKPLDSHRDRPLNQIDRDDQTLVAIYGCQHSRQSIQRSATNAHSLSNFQVGMRFKRSSAFENSPHRVYFTVRNRDADIPHTDKIKHAVRPQYRDAVDRKRTHAHKNVARKQWDVYEAAPITPLMHCRTQRKERPDALLLQLGCDFLFVPRPGVNREPGGFFRQRPVVIRQNLFTSIKLVQTGLRHIQPHSTFQ